MTEARASASRITVTAEQLTDPGRDGALRRGAGAARPSRCSGCRRPIRSCSTNQNFLTLQSQLEGTENRIAVARRDYNEAVQDYNTDDPDLPDGDRRARIIYGASRWCRTRPTEAAQRAPTVDFGNGQ